MSDSEAGDLDSDYSEPENETNYLLSKKKYGQSRSNSFPGRLYWAVKGDIYIYKPKEWGFVMG